MNKLNITCVTLCSNYNTLEPNLINGLCSIISGGTEILICGRKEGRDVHGTCQTCLTVSPVNIVSPWLPHHTNYTY